MTPFVSFTSKIVIVFLCIDSKQLKPEIFKTPFTVTSNNILDKNLTKF